MEGLRYIIKIPQQVFYWEKMKIIYHKKKKIYRFGQINMAYMVNNKLY